MTTLDNLLDAIFDGKRPAFYAEFERWVRNSRRFRAFASEHRSKIRAKLRNVRGEAGMRDLRVELQTAALLLQDERFALEYEKYAASKQRGPDFTATFRTNTIFNVEVRRLRSVDLAGEDTEARVSKLMTVVCDKVEQMPPSVINLLWLAAEREISEDDLSRALITLRQLAEQKTEDFFTRRGFESAASFLKHYRQLSGIVVHQSDEILLWLNPLARHKLPPDIARALQRLGTL